MVSVPPETRAEVARRRLAELAATFDADLPDPERPAPGRRRRPGAVARVIRPAHVRLVTVLGVAAAFLLVWWLVATRPHEEPVAPQQVQVEATAETATADLVVDVAGEVRRPGIVTLPPGSRVHEAIEAAGGVRGSVDTTGINLARVLNDGEQIVVGAPAAQSAGGDVG